MCCEILLVMVFGLSTMTTTNTKSNFLTSNGHVCKMSLMKGGEEKMNILIVDPTATSRLRRQVPYQCQIGVKKNTMDTTLVY